MTLGEKLKEKRNLHKLSIKEVAQYIGKSQQTVYRYENDILQPPISVLVKLSELLEFDLNTLVPKNESVLPEKDFIGKLDDGTTFYIELEKQNNNNYNRIQAYYNYFTFLSNFGKLNEKDKLIVIDLITSLLKNHSDN